MIFLGRAPAARGCSIERERGGWGGGESERRLLLGELPLRGAARFREGKEACFWGSSRCAGLLD